ncbi:MAG: hypothetical protein BWY66_02495 [bacterium ADurb.Bin374]|nr:MAG: hypothetical protein BWY66_02495 [bacterium ADurb.Bin374]
MACPAERESEAPVDMSESKRFPQASRAGLRMQASWSRSTDWGSDAFLATRRSIPRSCHWTAVSGCRCDADLISFSALEKSPDNSFPLISAAANGLSASTRSSSDWIAPIRASASLRCSAAGVSTFIRKMSRSRFFCHSMRSRSSDALRHRPRKNRMASTAKKHAANTRARSSSVPAGKCSIGKYRASRRILNVES